MTGSPTPVLLRRSPAVLYKVDTDNNRLIVEWDNIYSYNGNETATFQAILQLNTGTTAGRIIYNYNDVLIDGPGDNGRKRHSRNQGSGKSGRQSAAGQLRQPSSVGRRP